MKEIKKIKVYIVGNSIHYKDFIFNSVLVNNIDNADVVLFTGGEDVNPALYGEKTHVTTYYNKSRDDAEMSEYQDAIDKQKFMVGVCRGAQLLTVLSGGLLIQDIFNHSIYEKHLIRFNDNDVVAITSTHHQMMFPFNLPENEYTLIAWSNDILSLFHCNGEGDDIEIEKEPEIVYYNKTNCLCIQGHPENMNHHDAAVIKINALIQKGLNNELL